MNTCPSAELRDMRRQIVALQISIILHHAALEKRDGEIAAVTAELEAAKARLAGDDRPAAWQELASAIFLGAWAATIACVVYLA